MENLISHRKRDHLRICIEEDVQFTKTNGFENYEFTHVALPEVEYSAIDTSSCFLGKKFSTPLFIEAMTGGCSESKKINHNLAEAAQICGIGMGLGSQRAMLSDPSLTDTYQVRQIAPDIFLAGNIGATQLKEISVKDLNRAIKVIEADALVIHLNATQELCQTEGNTNWKNIFIAIENICKSVRYPVIVKETGCGLNANISKMLENAGVSCLDIGGSGGTSWARVEHYRGSKNAYLFFEWGIPTADSLAECKKSVHIPLIASGGIRNGIEIVKSISMGAVLAGMAFPLLKPAMLSIDHVIEKIEQLRKEIADTMFLIGARGINDVHKTRLKKISDS